MSGMGEEHKRDDFPVLRGSGDRYPTPWAVESSASLYSQYSTSPATSMELDFEREGYPPTSSSSYLQTFSSEYKQSTKYEHLGPKTLPNGARPTPSSLGWTLPSEWIKLYKFVVKQDGKERYFDLLPGLAVTSNTPERVELDLDPAPVKGAHRCMFPGGCKGKQVTFGRPADLDRHYKNVHASEDEKSKFYCDYGRCARALEPFTRKDHYRDHLRDFHKEDVCMAKGQYLKTKSKGTQEIEQEQEQWLRERLIDFRYWRCSKCLTRNVVAKSGWDCSKCKTSCESGRVDARRVENYTATRTSELAGTMAEESDNQYSPAIYASNTCSICNGSTFVDGGYGAWVDCPSCQPT